MTTENNNEPSKPDNSFMSDFGSLTTKEGTTNNDVLDLYTKYADNYEEFMNDINFTAAVLATKYYTKHARRFGFDSNSVILDVGAGSGSVGKLLVSQYGYKHVDAIEPCEKILDVARSKSIYRNTYLGKVGGGHKIPVEDNTYDAALTSGCIVPKHMPYDAMLEMARVVKPGGLVVNVMREEFTWLSDECELRKPFSQWQCDDTWDIVEWAIPDTQYFKNQDALVHVYRVK